MNLNDKLYLNDEEDAGDEGKSGSIAFSYKDPSTLETRDDSLSPEEIRRLLAVHKDIHKGKVDNQKNLRQTRSKNQKGDLVSAAYHSASTNYAKSGHRFGQQSNFLEHPLASKFSGQDPKVSQNPQNYVPTTNEKEQKDKELVMEQQLTNKISYKPGVSIKPPRPF